eukprot:990141-Ditylum_brightwellii.AAC.1
MNFAAAAIHYNFHIPSVIRFAGGNYTAEYRDIEDILKKIKQIIPHEKLLEVERVFKVGSPNILIAESSEENFMTYWRYGNHKSLEKNMKKVQNVVNNEDWH